LGSSVLAMALAACASNGPDMTDPGDDGSGVLGDGGLVPPPAHGFQVSTPEAMIPAHTEITYCFYFLTPNTKPMVIKRWSSMMTNGSHHLTMYTTTTPAKPAGTFDTDDCGGFNVGSGGFGSIPSWTYATQTPSAEVVLPTDDGTGKPLGQEI